MPQTTLESLADRRKLVAARTSIARIAEDLGLQHKEATGNLLRDAQTIENGWNLLALECCHHIRELQQANGHVAATNDLLREELKSLRASTTKEN